MIHMKFNLVIIIGVVLSLAGILGFLASAVALSSVDEISGVKTPEGTELTLDPDDPLVAKRKSQAETVLFGSLLSGVVGLLFIGTGILKKMRSRYRPAGRV